MFSASEVAESVERSVAARALPGGDVHARSGVRVMVCMSSLPGDAATLLRRGSRMAGRLNTDRFVVYVETPGEAPHLIDAETQRNLLANIERARELGAEVVRLKAPDAVEALLDFARSHGVGHIIIGRSHQPWWRQLLGHVQPDGHADRGRGEEHPQDHDHHRAGPTSVGRHLRMRQRFLGRCRRGDRSRETHHQHGRNESALH